MTIDTNDRELRLVGLLSATAVRPSFLRCCEHGSEFLDSFYATLAITVPRTAAMFHGVDMQAQNQLVRDGIERLLDFAEEPTDALAELERLAELHSAGRLRVEPGMYDGWIESLVATVRELDPLATEPLLAGWREVLRVGIQFMADRY